MGRPLTVRAPWGGSKALVIGQRLRSVGFSTIAGKSSNWNVPEKLFAYAESATAMINPAQAHVRGLVAELELLEPVLTGSAAMYDNAAWEYHGKMGLIK
jgi:hypothetical protein